jgi:hypothetical protein
MAIVDVEVQIAGESGAEIVPIRKISVSAALRGVGASGPAATPSEPEQAPPQEKSE